jgi:Predicted ferric reductase
MSEPSCYEKAGRVFFREKFIPRKSQVMKKLGVKKNTYAGNLISRVYDYYFNGALNFRNEYRKYYRKEFRSVEKFIEEHFNIEHNEAKRLAADDYSMKDSLYRSVERNIETLNYDQYLKNAISEAIGGLEYEN